MQSIKILPDSIRGGPCPLALPCGSVTIRFSASIAPRQSVLLSIFSENKYCLIPSEAGLAPSGSPAALSPEDPAHLSRPGDLFLFIFSENRYCQISAEAARAPITSENPLRTAQAVRRGLLFMSYTRNGERIYRLRRKMLPPFGGPICVKPADSNMASAMRLV